MKRIIFFVMVALIFTSQVAKGEESVIANGKTVKFDYTLKVDGKVVDTSEGKEPLEYVQGQKMIIPGLEKQLEGMKVGDEKDVTVAAKDAYGEVNPQAVLEVSKANLGEGITPEVGMMLQFQGKEGQPIPGVVKEVKDDTIIVDFNHPLAGKELNFHVKIIEIK